MSPHVAALLLASFGQAPAPVDATTLTHKVIAGYQGWFRCPGDPAGEGWRHWSRDARRITPASLTVEMWPDTSEFPDAETYPAPGFTRPDGSPARLFSSANPATVDRHFRWMRDYGIDGVFVQRFLVNVGNPSFDRVLENVRASAAAHGRVYAIGYDLSGTRPDRLVARLAADWKRLVGERQIDRDRGYLHHKGKPVVFVWGFYPDRFGPEIAHAIIDIFKADTPQAATLIGGCPWQWRSERNPEWARAFCRFDVISPWNVGNHTRKDGRQDAATSSWPGDIAEAKRHAIDFLPVLYPGFAWTNLKGKDAARATIPRSGGEFFWRQFARAGTLGVEMAYVAMFDEVDEATAIFKVSNTPPTQAHFETLDGLPTDWYLRLAGEGAKIIRRERPWADELPFRP